MKRNYEYRPNMDSYKWCREYEANRKEEGRSLKDIGVLIAAVLGYLLFEYLKS